jgi:hypothetical protein
MDVLTFFKEYYNVTDEVVANNKEELNINTVIYNGDLLMPEEGFINYPNLKVIIGSAYLNNLVTAIVIENLEFIIGSAYFHNLKAACGLEKLKVISEDAFFDTLRNAKPVKDLDSIGGIGFFGNVRKDKYVKNIDIRVPYFPRIRKKKN